MKAFKKRLDYQNTGSSFRGMPTEAISPTSSPCPPETDESHQVMRVGAVSYLNSKPLIEGLEQRLVNGSLELNYPSVLADELASGLLDVALIPSVEYCWHPEYVILSNACVAARGPVMSVKLFSRVPMGEIRTLALDQGSRTSAMLTRVMLAERYGVYPDLEPLSMTSTTEDCATDAVLLIGDRAMHSPKEKFVATWDLGEEWYQWTGLPFVFAMWVARGDGDFNETEGALIASRDEGVSNLEEIARREAGALNLSVDRATTYLTKNLHYHLSSPERTGMKLFFELAGSLNLVPHVDHLRFRDRSPAAACC